MEDASAASAAADEVQPASVSGRPAGRLEPGSPAFDPKSPPKYRDARMQAHVERAFVSRPPTGDQAVRYAAINKASRALAQLMVDQCPPSAELTLALRHVEDARMRANQAIAVNEPSE